MKTYNNLYGKVCSFENLLIAAKKAQKGKRFKENTAWFNFNIEKELLKLQNELFSQTYQPGEYKQFIVYESKKRLISAAPYRDRIVHHALCNIIEPLFEKTFIYDSYANRKEKGTHKAIQRFTEFSRRNKYVLKCDMVEYFGSIDCQLLFNIIAEKIKDEKVMRLVEKILGLNAYSNSSGNQLSLPFASRCGLPIGNLTSQFFANLYLNKFDHFIKEQLRCKYYIRYVDDFVVLGNDKLKLREIKSAIENYLVNLQLQTHPHKTQIFPVEQGTDFLGFKIFPIYRLVRKSNFFYFRHKLLKLRKLYYQNKINTGKVTQSIQSWIAHASWGDTWRLRTKLFNEISF
ncbi:MAG: RNA-dependent DNA polymerase [Elusimicrobia bacterium CG_4_10_14_0_8_um_filter_37_32]|nr:MAG: RNA-dependent DNA polymerase [Elusimicrobia bacterium CG02_land_8_20_14_3_00_37_13]PIZ14255.1 MAG: RNA-dependent DNA polymerase [Elusimicrobia bacterium CG_4_10_14_0_8_um_filter_37_32]